MFAQGGQDDGVSVNTAKEVPTATDAKISNQPLEAGVISMKKSSKSKKMSEGGCTCELWLAWFCCVRNVLEYWNCGGKSYITVIGRGNCGVQG
jgi:hypothetical protein